MNSGKKSLNPSNQDQLIKSCSAELTQRKRKWNACENVNWLRWTSNLLLQGEHLTVTSNQKSLERRVTFTAKGKYKKCFHYINAADIISRNRGSWAFYYLSHQPRHLASGRDLSLLDPRRTVNGWGRGRECRSNFPPSVELKLKLQRNYSSHPPTAPLANFLISAQY